MTFSYPIGVDGDHLVFSFLLLSPVTVASSGPYQCKAINENGAAVLNMGQLLGKRGAPAAVCVCVCVCVWLGHTCHLRQHVLCTVQQ